MNPIKNNQVNKANYRKGKEKDQHNIKIKNGYKGIKKRKKKNILNKNK